jgi:hypothetical protein
MSNQSVKLPAQGLEEARRFLRGQQAKFPTKPGEPGITLEKSKLASTLAQLDKRKGFQTTDDPQLVIREGLKFNREIEERRIALAEDLIRRVDPGPFEDANYLALLAYQAASIEMALPDRTDGRPIDWGWSRFLLGTIHSAELNAFAKTFKLHDYTVTAVYSALIEFAYQAAKALIAAQNPVSSTDHRGFVTVDSSPDHIAAQLDHNQEPVERLYRTLEGYFFEGYPRVFYGETVPVEHVIPLTNLISMAERWIIAHEYGHGFAAGIKAKFKLAPESPDRAEEYFADNNATILTALSAVRLDGLPADIALIGGTFALACLEVVRRGLSVVRYGKVLRYEGDKKHPPNRMRAENVLNAFNFFFDTHSSPTGIDWALILRPDKRPVDDTEETRQRRARVLQYPDALFAIWDRAHPRLLKDFENKRSLHQMWR